MLLAAGLLAEAPACSSDSGPKGPRQVAVSPEAEISVGDNGAVSLTVSGRKIFSMSEKRAVELRTYEEDVEGLVGIWVFRRDEERALPAGSLDEIVPKGDGGAEIRFKGGGGRASGTITVSKARDGATRLRFAFSAKDAKSIAIPIACDADATFYGFGEQYNFVEQRGQAFQLMVSEQGIGRDPRKPPGGTNGDLHTTYFPMPYYLDARGFGVLARTDRRVNVDLCKTDADIAWLEVTNAEPVDLIVFHGPKPADVVRQLNDEVGRPQAPPDWAYELWIGAQGGRDAILAEADRLEAASIPAKVLWVQDWTGRRRNFDGGFGVQYRWRPDEAFYPDLPGMIGTLKQRGYRFLSYANPFIDTGLEHFREMDPRGLLVRKQDGTTYTQIAPNGQSSHADLTNPDAREYVKNELRQMVTKFGMDGWMSDFGEWAPLDAVYKSGIDGDAMHNRYPIEWHRLWREVMDELRPDGDYVVFSRSGWTGVQAVSQIHWVGDQECTWSPYDGLPTVVPAMTTLGLAGVPYVTHDIAGFSGGPSTKELFLRWTELGAFTPIMRTHEGNRRDQNWSWKSDEETTAFFRRFANIHRALIPDLKKAAAEASQSSLPMVRHLLLAYPDDAESRRTHDEYLLGGDLLVAPVVEEGATKRRVYLPPGTWFHVWTGQRFDGGKAIEVDAPLGSPPVFSRDRDREDLRGIR